MGSYFAPNLLTLQVFFALEGAGSIFIGVIAATLIADSLPPNQRAKVISYLFSVGAAVTLVLIPIVGFVSEMGGWRLGSLTFCSANFYNGTSFSDIYGAV